MAHFILSLVLLAAPPSVKLTRWMSPGNERPMTFRQWHASQPASAPWNVTRVAASAASSDDKTDILVQASLVSWIADRLDTMVADLASEGTSATVYAIEGISAESLRAFLQAEYATGLKTAVLVGDLPIAWFQLIDDWDGNGSRSSDEGYEEFPCDYFFMDLDGTWQDLAVQLDTLDSLVPGSDSIYDLHTGAIEPEIAVSRLPASRCGSGITLIQQYLDRDHAYRTGNLPVTGRALVYIDDDWEECATEWDGNVGQLYWQRTLVSAPESTRIADYRPRIDTAAYQWIQLCSHSWPGGHAMYFHNRDSMDWFYASEIPGLDPEAIFYNLFACSNARFVENYYCGGMYVFKTSTGLASVGSTKTGSMLDFGNYYAPLGAGENLGAALKDWFAAEMGDTWETWEKSWFMGMCTTGDATLKPLVPTALADDRGLTPDAARPTLEISPTICRAGTAVSLRLTANGSLTPFSLSVFSSSGHLVRSFVISTSDFVIPRLRSGTYFVRLASAWGTSATKLIVTGSP